MILNTHRNPSPLLKNKVINYRTLHDDRFVIFTGLTKTLTKAPMRRVSFIIKTYYETAVILKFSEDDVLPRDSHETAQRVKS